MPPGEFEIRSVALTGKHAITGIQLGLYLVLEAKVHEAKNGALIEFSKESFRLSCAKEREKKGSKDSILGLLDGRQGRSQRATVV